MSTTDDPVASSGGPTAPGPTPSGPTPTGQTPVVGEDLRPTSEVLTSLLANGQALATKEFELAKHELSELVRDKAIAIGLAVFAAILGLFILGFIGVTAAVALSLVLPAWAAWLIVTGLYLLVAVVLVLVAVRLLKRPAFARTKASIEELKSWAKGQVSS